MPIPSFPLSSLLSFSSPLLSSLISKLWRRSSPIPTPHVMGDFLPRLVALKAVDTTILKTTMITGPVALCVPPFDKLGLPLHFVVGPPVLVEFLPLSSLSSFCYLQVTSGTSSEPYWLTRPPFFGCNLCSCRFSGGLPCSWSTILVHLEFGGFPMPIPPFRSPFLSHPSCLSPFLYSLP